jgi:hypothetical protein
MNKTICISVMMACSALITPAASLAQSWTNLGSGLNSGGYALAFDRSGSLYVGGDFTNAGGVAANRIAKWDGSTWASLAGERAGGNVYELAFDSAGNLYAAGGNTIEKWNGTTWTNISAGMDWYVYALACDNSGNLYAGGSFTMVGGVQVNHVAKWDGTSWSSLGGGMDYYVEALVCDGAGNLYAGGDFTNAGGVAANYVAKWNGTSWSSLGSGIHSERPYVVKALALDGSGNLYAGGDFSSAGDVDAFAVARWNGTSWASLGRGMDFKVNALALDRSGNLYAGGDFNTAGGAAASRVAAWNGIAWSSLGSGLNNSPEALACDGSGALYAAGYFSTAGGIPADHIARWIPAPVGPIIKANGSTNDIIINHSDHLSVTVQINPGQYDGINVDWWVVALAGSSWYYLDSSIQWTPFDGNLSNCHPVNQGALFNLPAMEVLNITGLQAGSYTFWFAVDYPMDGILNLDGPMLLDSVNVNVQ